MISLTGIIIVLMSVIITTIFVILLSKAYRIGDFSLVFPITKLTPAIVSIFAFILIQEKASKLGLIGVGFTIIGAYILFLKSFKIKEILYPFIHIRNKANKLAFICLVLSGMYFTIDKIGLGYLEPVIYNYLLFLILSLIIGIYFWLSKQVNEIIREWRINKKKIIPISFLYFLMYFITLTAMSHTKVSYVVSIRKIGIIFVF